MSDPAISATTPSSTRSGDGSATVTSAGRELSEGDSGAAVRAVQRKVGSEPDGIFGPRTESAVERYQRAHGLQVDGIVGPQTAAALAGAHRDGHSSPAHPAHPADASGSPSRESPAHRSGTPTRPVDAKGTGVAPARPADVHASPAKSSPVHAPASPGRATPPAGREAGTPERRYDGWSDAGRGANVNLGDTESALHLYYAAHPDLGGRPPAAGTQEARELDSLHLTNAAQRFDAEADPAETHWTSAGSRAIAVTAADREAAWSIYSAQHPELGGKRPAAKSADAVKLHAFEKDVAQNRYNATLDRSLDAHPTAGIDAKVLKSLLVEESNFNPDVGSNRYGYTGIAQLGRGIASNAQANDPLQAIPLAARTLQQKAHYLDTHAFRQYGAPANAEDRTRFVLGAYNGGEGTIEHAIEGAHETGSARAREAHLTGKAAEDTANTYATQWTSIIAPVNDPKQSPLYEAIPSAWGKAAKYREIGTYAPDIVERAEQ